jgi:hypothetical protein
MNKCSTDTHVCTHVFPHHMLLLCFPQMRSNPFLPLTHTGTWGACASNCKRPWTQSTAPSGNGKACPTISPSCAAGEGACPADIDCTGTWSECSVDCKRDWTLTTAKSGNGKSCPKEPTCNHGDHLCPHPDIDCTGTVRQSVNHISVTKSLIFSHSVNHISVTYIHCVFIRFIQYGIYNLGSFPGFVSRSN